MDIRKIMDDLVAWLVSLAAVLLVQLRSCRQSGTHEHQECQEYSCVTQKVIKNDLKHKLRGIKMKSSKSGIAPASFMQRMLHNNFLLLTVVLAVGTAAFIGFYLFRLLSY